MEGQKAIDQIKSWLGNGSINIFGMPFTGKSTQGRVLADLLDAKLLSGGDILRSHHTPKDVRKMMDEGKLVPSEDFVKLVLPALSKDELRNHPLILSAIGRRSGEETEVMQAATASGHPLKAVLFLQMPEKSIEDRWLKASVLGDRGQRKDDSLEVLRVRLQEYRQKTLPVIEFYRQNRLLIEVDGSPSVEEVTNMILEKLTMASLAS